MDVELSRVHKSQPFCFVAKSKALHEQTVLRVDNYDLLLRAHVEHSSNAKPFYTSYRFSLREIGLRTIVIQLYFIFYCILIVNNYI